MGGFRLDFKDVVKAVSAIAKGVADPGSVKGLVEAEGELLGLAHCCERVRDDPEHEDFRESAAAEIGCDVARLKQILTALQKIAYESAKDV